MEPGRSASERERPGISVKGAAAAFATAEDVLAFRAKLLRRMRTRLDETAAEDVVQEIFLQAYRDFGRYDGARSALQTWLARLGDQIVAKHFRRRGRRLRAEAGHAQDRGQAHPLSPEEQVEIRDLLESLTELNHRIVAARFLLGESVEEIAAQTGLSEEAIRQRISRSLALLRNSAAGSRPS